MKKPAPLRAIHLIETVQPPTTDLSRIFSRSSLAMDANSETTIPTLYIHITAPEKE